MACAGCGTRREEAPVLPPKSKRRRWWADVRLHYVGYFFVVMLLYFGSFGPVMYFFSRVTPTTSTVSGTTFTTTMTVQLPGWAGIAYYPAFWLYTATDKGYGRYVNWWIARQHEVKEEGQRLKAKGKAKDDKSVGP